MDLDEQVLNRGTKLLITALKEDLISKFNLTENHVIKIIVYEKKT